jgi:hypothetical protein
MAARKSLSKKIRFEVFKRDSFTCQYCGKSAPTVLLEVDHIKPVSKDGDDDVTNLITACFDCNRGKSDRELSDDAVVLKRKNQLDELQERREQIEMMMEWRGCLDDIKEQELEKLVDYINERIPRFYINENGIKNIRSSLRKYGLSEMLESVSISADQYIEYSKGDSIYSSSVDKFLNYIPKIAKNRDLQRKKPYMRDLYRIRSYMKSKGFYIGYEAIGLLECAYKKLDDFDELESIVTTSNNWSEWRARMEYIING